jgi:seryl-tRNA synthetase
MIKKSEDKVSQPRQLNNREVQLALIENFVNLQRVLTNLTVKFDNLSDNISRLLQLFEISAKSFVKKQEEPALGEDKDLIKKLDTLLDQNKTIAKGLTLIEEKIRHKTASSADEELSRLENNGQRMMRPRPLPRM